VTTRTDNVSFKNRAKRVVTTELLNAYSVLTGKPFGSNSGSQLSVELVDNSVLLVPRPTPAMHNATGYLGTPCPSRPNAAGNFFGA
jgi:hypothetical protein